MDGLTEGRIVHYVMPVERYGPIGAHCPAIVVNAQAISKDATGFVNLQVFVDSPEGTMWVAGVPYREDALPGSWHWIERA